MTSSDKILGIDLGTTNSVLAMTENGVPKIYPIDESDLLPSIVGVSADGEILVGKTAHNQWIVAPERTIRSIKRQMGKDETVEMAGQSYTPQEISAFVLRAIKDAAEAAIGQPVTRAVITVPAYFNEVQRQATMEAGAIAGLDVERIINEPTAAALAYGYGINDDEHMRILVYDLGGGTFDVSIIELNYGVVDVMATAGDNYLGGDDFDERLAELIAEEFAAEHEIDLHDDQRAWNRLLRAAEEAKIALSGEPDTTVELEYIADDATGNPLHIRRSVSRLEFIERIQDLLESTITCIDNALKDAQLETSDIDRILLVGGSTRIPAVTEMVSSHMGQDPHGEVDPDAAVALGAAVQAAIIAGEEIDAVLVDVTPLSLGVETATITMAGDLQSDHFAPLIRRNTTIPVQKSELFTTMHPAQDTVQIKVFQGESQRASENVLLGEFMFEGLEPSMERDDGLPEVHVNFRLDVNGILDVTVTDKTTGNQVSEQMKASRQRLSPDEISASQAKLSSVAAATTVDGALVDDTAMDPGVKVLLDRADEAVESEDMAEELKAEIRRLRDQVRQAVEAGDEDQVEEFSDELIDILMDAED
ncbi:MAG: Hsp70 family protein [Chloroflexota bacterium]